MLLKLIVFVDGERVSFVRDKLSAYFYLDEGAPYLMVNDLTKTPSRKIAGFAKWDYWYFEEE